MIEYTYDNLGRRIGEYWYADATSANADSTPGSTHANATHSFTYAYDADGNLLTASDNDPTNGSTDTYGYDNLDRVTSDSQDVKKLPTAVLSSGYDSLGQRTSLSATLNGVPDFANAYQFDNVGRLTQVRQTPSGSGDAVAPKQVNLGYDADGNLSAVTFYDDTAKQCEVATAAYGCDNLGRVTSLAYSQGATTLAAYGLQYDADGNVRLMTSARDGTSGTPASVTCGYDNLGQLTSATYAAWKSGTAPADFSTTYDPAGNPSTTDGKAQTANADNELRFDGFYNYLYDADGNCIAKFKCTDGINFTGTAVPSGATDVTLYTWDNRNRLIEADSYRNYTGPSQTADQTTSYVYDYLNRLVRETTVNTVNNTTQQTGFAYDGDQAVFRFQSSSAQSMRLSCTIDRYLWNPQAVNQLFADEKLDLSGGESLGTLWALTDAENSIRDLAFRDPQSGVTSVVNHRVYDSLGNLTSDTPSGPAGLPVNCIFGYTGQMFDQATGLQNNLNRWYDPSTGRWMSQDPLGLLPDTNAYRYCGNNPMSSVDPSGLSSEPVGVHRGPHRSRRRPLPCPRALSSKT